MLSPQPQFTDRTPHESICMTCYATVRAAHTEHLEDAQSRHANECSGLVGCEADRSDA